MKKISLRPYHGVVYYCETKQEWERYSEKLFGEKDVLLEVNGRLGWSDEEGAKPEFLVWAKKSPYLAHEMAHVCFEIFRRCGIDPACGNNEPFCYLLTQLLLEAKGK